LQYDCGGENMSISNERLLSGLFSTKAIRVCPEDKPFWYTSGTIGPYYINTHFLYGSEEKANELLKVIDDIKENILECPSKVFELTRKNYDEVAIFKNVIDDMCTLIKQNIDLNEVDCISGGERRDWFFSLLISEMLNMPHITIYKDLTTVISENGHTRMLDDLKGKKVLHIADLITEASSYERAWIPAVKKLGGEIRWSVVVVDRNQGGKELLAANGIRSFAMIYTNSELFNRAAEMGLINKRQLEMLLDFIKNPRESMRNFLKKNPTFIEDALNSDEKTKERAKLCIEKNFYGL